MVKIKKDGNAEERILFAAKKIFISKGLAGARMQDIADEAGINKALLHYYFKNKEQLFETIFISLTHDFWPQLTSIFESDQPLFGKIEAFCAAYIQKVIENPYIPLFVLYEMNQRPTRFVKRMFRGSPPNPGKFLEQIRQEVSAGSIHPIDPVQLITNMLSMCVFPFIGKPMIMAVMNMDEETFLSIMEQRKKEVPAFIISSLRK